MIKNNILSTLPGTIIMILSDGILQVLRGGLMLTGLCLCLIHNHVGLTVNKNTVGQKTMLFILEKIFIKFFLMQ